MPTSAATEVIARGADRVGSNAPASGMDPSTGLHHIRRDGSTAGEVIARDDRGSIYTWFTPDLHLVKLSAKPASAMTTSEITPTHPPTPLRPRRRLADVADVAAPATSARPHPSRVGPGPVRGHPSPTRRVGPAGLVSRRGKGLTAAELAATWDQRTRVDSEPPERCC
jgi:hypothetical protein